MIGQRVKVAKFDGTVYFGHAIRWESSDILVIKPEEAGSLEKRAFLAQGDRVTTALASDAAPVADKRARYKNMVDEMTGTPDCVKKYTKLTEGMSE